MGDEMQKLLDAEDFENLQLQGDSLKKINRRKFEEEIILVDENNINELHKNFLNDNEDLSFRDMRLIKRVFDFIKKYYKEE